MNIRKPVDYSAMYAELASLMAAGLPQMELYCGIGKVIIKRPENESSCLLTNTTSLCWMYLIQGIAPKLKDKSVCWKNITEIC